MAGDGMFQKRVEPGAETASGQGAAAAIWLELTGLNGEKVLIRADAIIHVVEHRSGTYIQTIADGSSAGIKVKESRDHIVRRMSEAGAKIV